MKGVWAWLFQRVTGIILLAGLIVHFFIMHFSGPEQIRHESVIQRLSNPYWIAFDFAFLVSAVYHGFNGLWGMVVEYVSSAKLQKGFQIVLMINASLLIAIGIYVLAL